MKKQYLLPIISLLFGFVIQSCTDKEEAIPDHQEKLPVFTNARKDEALAKGLELVNQFTLNNGRSDFDFSNLQSKEAMVVGNEQITNYSYALSKSKLVLKNLVISETDGIYRAGIFTFIREDESVSWKKFEGEITLEFLDGERVVELTKGNTGASRMSGWWCETTTWHIGYLDSDGDFVETYTEVEVGRCW